MVRRVFCLHSEHHFCYSLSSIPLYGRRVRGGHRGDCSDRGHPVPIPKTATRGVILGSVEVVSVDGKGGLKEFIEFQYTLYSGDPYFVPQPRMAIKDLLNREKHPFYANADMELFLARENGKVVGRVAAIFDRSHNRFHEEAAGFFGFFESIDNQGVADALLGKARQWLKDRGA